MFAAQARLRSILNGRFTFKFGSFNWIRFMITSLCPFTYCTYNPEKVSRYYEKNKKKRTVLCGMLSLSYISSQIKLAYTLYIMIIRNTPQAVHTYDLKNILLSRYFFAPLRYNNKDRRI